MNGLDPAACAEQWTEQGSADYEVIGSWGGDIPPRRVRIDLTREEWEGQSLSEGHHGR